MNRIVALAILAAAVAAASTVPSRRSVPATNAWFESAAKPTPNLLCLPTKECPCDKYPLCAR
jgi:hypothetical protein